MNPVKLIRRLLRALKSSDLMERLAERERVVANNIAIYKAILDAPSTAQIKNNYQYDTTQKTNA